MDRKYNNAKGAQQAKPCVAPAGMRRETTNGKIKVAVPTEESVREAVRWVQEHQQ